MKNSTLPLFEHWLYLNQYHAQIEQTLEKNLTAMHDLSLKEFYVLYFLAQKSEKQLRLQDLQEFVGLSQSAMSRLVSRFEAKGCGVLERRICETDRRGVYTSITKKGEDKLDEAMKTVNQILAQSFKECNLESIFAQPDKITP